MYKETVQVVLHAICLGFVATCLLVLMRNKEMDRKWEILTGIITWVAASVVFILFFRILI